MHCTTIIDAIQGITNLNLMIKKSSHLTTFACQIGRYRFTRLPFGVAPVGDMFHRNIDKIFKGLPNIFVIADDILIVAYDTEGRDHNRTLGQVMLICW